MNYKIEKSTAEWQAQLSPEAYQVLRNKGTERAFTGKYNDFEEVGTYFCAGCEHELFSSATKYHSGCGWPSFFDELDTANIEKKTDVTHGMKRTEILCSNCGGHLGHVFNDGPKPTGLRYCLNSLSLTFKPKNK